jgi:hypothetical protein
VAEPFLLTAITADPSAAAEADAAGVDRIGIDIERIGKVHRQGHRPDARISGHELDDLSGIAAVVKRGRVFARLNPIHAGSPEEVEQALRLGARSLMLPYFDTSEQAAQFIGLVKGRAEVSLLVETRGAVDSLPEILRLSGIDEVMVGLNDLHMSLGLASHFEVVVSETMARIARQVRDAGIRFGFGGLGRAMDEALPVRSDLVYAQYPRLGARSAWLARVFYRGLVAGRLAEEVTALRERMAYWWAQPDELLSRQCEELAAGSAPARVVDALR